MRRERPGHTLDTTGLVNEAYHARGRGRERCRSTTCRPSCPTRKPRS
jgi:hypothetical protein